MTARHRNVTASMLALGLIAAPAQGHAYELSDRGPFRTRAEVDVPWILAAGLITLGDAAFTSRFVTMSKPPFDRDDVPPFDRFSLDKHSTAAAKGSDAAVATIVALSLVVTTWPDRGEGPGTMGSDVVVVTESILTTTAILTLAKFAVSRVRPFAYSLAEGDPRLQEGFTFTSMPSGHTASAFAAAASLTASWAIRHHGSRATPWIGVGTGVTAAGIGLLRMLAGKHFPSDVMVGALIGTAAGITVPLVHAR